MFTGIIENIGIVRNVQREGTNRRFAIESSIAPELIPAQSVSHNGVCLTIEKVSGKAYEVVAIEETLTRSNLGDLKEGDLINLERSLKIGDRLDGHFVQGHVDQTAFCKSVSNQNGSYVFSFQINADNKNLLVEKGSVCINGVSLTVASLSDNTFSVAIIPFTFEHTNFKSIKQNDKVNIEYDIFGKYVRRILQEK